MREAMIPAANRYSALCLKSLAWLATRTQGSMTGLVILSPVTDILQPSCQMQCRGSVAVSAVHDACKLWLKRSAQMIASAGSTHPAAMLVPAVQCQGRAS